MSERSKEFWLRMAAKEPGCPILAGAPDERDALHQCQMLAAIGIEETGDTGPLADLFAAIHRTAASMLAAGDPPKDDAASPHPIARAGLDVGRAADPYAHADGSRECRPATGKWSRPDAEARARELLADGLLATGLEFSAECVRDGMDTQIWSDAAIRAIAKALAPAERGAEWRPIETAPKDGTWFIALQNDETYPCAWEVMEPDEGPPEEGWFDFFNRSFEAPSHWVPCPAAAIRQLKGGTHE